MHERSGGATDGVRVRSPIGDEYPLLGTGTQCLLFTSQGPSRAERRKNGEWNKVTTYLYDACGYCFAKKLYF
jgi:hypothetical protein